MNRKLKIPTQRATEAFECMPLETSSNVRLLGTEPLKVNKADKFLEFLDVVSLEDKFYYNLTAICKRDGCEKSETGIGHLEKDGDDVILVRDSPYAFAEDDKPIDHNGPLEFCEVDSQYVATTYYPRNIFEYIVFNPDTIIHSNSQGLPHVVQLKNDSILSYIDGEICSLSFEQLAERLNEYT